MVQKMWEQEQQLSAHMANLDIREPAAPQSGGAAAMSDAAASLESGRNRAAGLLKRRLGSEFVSSRAGHGKRE